MLFVPFLFSLYFVPGSCLTVILPLLSVYFIPCYLLTCLTWFVCCLYSVFIIVLIVYFNRIAFPFYLF